MAAGTSWHRKIRNEITSLSPYVYLASVCSRDRYGDAAIYLGVLLTVAWKAAVPTQQGPWRSARPLPSTAPPRALPSRRRLLPVLRRRARPPVPAGRLPAHVGPPLRRRPGPLSGRVARLRVRSLQLPAPARYRGHARAPAEWQTACLVLRQTCK